MTESEFANAAKIRGEIISMESALDFVVDAMNGNVSASFWMDWLTPECKQSVLEMAKADISKSIAGFKREFDAL